MSDLCWEATYAIARELVRRHPEIDLNDVSLEMIFNWTINLPEFTDDPDLANDDILTAILQEWFEEKMV